MKQILMVDVGGTNVKLMASGHVGRRKVPSGIKLTPAKMVKEVLKATEDWEFECVSLGFPGLVYEGKPASSPVNLGPGWMNFDYEAAFGRPVRFINDAAMQALAAYQQGRLLFLGFGTGTGAAIVVDDVLIPIEIGSLPLARKENFGDLLSEQGKSRLGRKTWLKLLHQGVPIVQHIFKPDDTVLGGGNSKYIDPLPKGCRLRDNQGAFLGAVRLWPGGDMVAEAYGSSYRIKKTAKSEFPPAEPAEMSPPQPIAKRAIAEPKSKAKPKEKAGKAQTRRPRQGKKSRAAARDKQR